MKFGNRKKDFQNDTSAAKLIFFWHGTAFPNFEKSVGETEQSNLHIDHLSKS